MFVCCRALCDIKQSGKLNNEQFALAMWFVARCLKGTDPPPALTPEMVPPSFRSTRPADGLVVSYNSFEKNVFPFYFVIGALQTVKVGLLKQK